LSIPNAETPFPLNRDRIKWFARFLLEGVLFPPLKDVQEYFSKKPQIITRSWTIPEVISILQPLETQGIDTKQKLIQKWKKDSKFLLIPYLLWVKKAYHNQVIAIWPPIENKTLKVSAVKNSIQKEDTENTIIPTNKSDSDSESDVPAVKLSEVLDEENNSDEELDNIMNVSTTALNKRKHKKKK